MGFFDHDIGNVVGNVKLYSSPFLIDIEYFSSVVCWGGYRDTSAEEP